MALEINKLTNANIYINGVDFIGKAEEVTVPMIKLEKVEHKGLGLIGKPKFPVGINLEQAKIKWNSLYEGAISALANPYGTVNVQARASLETYTSQGRSAQKEVVCMFSGSVEDVPSLGTLKHLENAESETVIDATYLKLTIDGAEKYEVDTVNNIYKVDGVDMLEDFRTNLGI